MKKRNRIIPIGEKVVNVGFSSALQINKSLSEQKKRQNNGEKILLGDLLVEQGAISPNQLEALLDVNGLDNLTLSEEAVRLAIRLRTRFDEKNNLLLFSDINGDNNSSSIASQIAHALTLISDNQKVLLIDTNITQPSIHEIFSVPLAPGLSEVMSTKETLQSAISRTCVNNLSVLTSGNNDPFAVSRLVSRGFKKLLEEIRNDYAIVVINAASILEKSETILLASEVNQVIAVANQGETTKSELKEVEKIVRNIGSYFAGVILRQKNTRKRTNSSKKINVVHLLHTMNYGGIETIIINWLKVLDKEDINISIVCFANPGNTEEPFVKAAQNAGFSVQKIPWNRRKPILKSSTALKKILTEINADILHTHNTYADIVGLATKARMDIKLVSSLYVWAEFGWKRNILQWLNQKVLRWFDMITVQCQATLEESVNRGIHQDKLRILHSGFSLNTAAPGDNEKQQLRKKYGFTVDNTILINIARFYPEKAQDKLLIAFKQINKKFPKTRLLMLGVGPLDKELKSLCQSLGIENVVHFAGFIDDLDTLLNIVDLQVHPSYAEGIPMSILSGMSAGLPIIASDVGGIKEVIIDNITGRLIPSADDHHFEHHFTVALEQLLKNKLQMEKLGQNARSFIQNEYSLDMAAETLKNIYYETL